MLYSAHVLPARKSYLLLPLALLAALAAWQYGAQIWKGHPGDIYHRWVGSRELLLHGRDPYSPEVSREIQIGLNGHAYDPRRDVAEARFYYPVYVVFLMAPTVRLPFPEVKLLFTLLMLLVTAASVPLWLDFVQWRLSAGEKFAVIVLALASLPAMQGVYLQNLGLLVSALIAGACFAVRRGRLIAAGPLLAFATLKPHLVAPIAGCLFIWSLGAWKQRQRLVWSFVASIGVLILAGEALLPGWLSECARAIFIYPEKSFGESPLQLMFTRQLGLALALAAIVGTVWLAWKVRHEEASSAQFCVMACWALAATLIVVPSIVPYSDMQLLPGVLLLLKWRKQFWYGGRWLKHILAATVILVLWPYAAMVLLAGVRVVAAAEFQTLWIMPLAVMPVLPVFVAAAVGCAAVLQVRTPQAARAASVKSAT